MSDILKLANEFAKKKKKTEEYLNLVKARKDNDEDVNLNVKINEFNAHTDNVKRLIADGSPKEEVDSENVKISELYKEIMENKNMIAFNKASNEMNLLMNNINAILVAAVNDEDVSACSDRKSSGCSGCKKCSHQKI